MKGEAYKAQGSLWREKHTRLRVLYEGRYIQGLMEPDINENMNIEWKREDDSNNDN